MQGDRAVGHHRRRLFERPKGGLARAFLARWLPLGVVILLGALILYDNKSYEHDTQWILRQQATVDLEAAVFQGTLRDFLADPVLLAADRELRLLAEQGGEAARRLVLGRLLSGARTRQVFDQIRLLGADGRELARVRRAPDGDFAPVPGGDLPDVSVRVQFRRTMESPPRTICVSALELNREDGRAEEPPRPTLRISTPVMGLSGMGSGTPVGAVMMDLDAGRLLRRLEEVAARRGWEIYLLNPAGYLLTGPDPADCWGFMYPERRGSTFGALFPEVWAMVQAGGPGRVRNAAGLFTWSPVGIDGPVRATHAGAPQIRAVEGWVIVSRLTPSVLAPPWRWEFWLVIVILELAVAGCCLPWAVTALRRIRAELGLHEERALLQAVIGASRDAVVLIDGRGLVRIWNRAAEDMFGYSSVEMMGKSVHDRLAPEADRDRAREGLKLFAVTGQGKLVGPATLELEAVRRDGSRLPVELALAPIFLNGGWHAVGGLRDITERKRAEALVTASEQRFRDVSEAVSEFIWEVDPQGRYTFLTEDVAAVLGYRVDELLGRSMFELMPEDESAMIARWFEGLQREGQRFSKLDYSCLTREGETVWLSVSGVPVRGAEGRLVGYRGAAMDITDRKRAERALMEREETIRAMSEASHDAIVMVDAEGRVSFWNRAAERIFGYSSQETAGREIYALMAADGSEQAWAKTGLAEFVRTGGGPLAGNLVEMTGRRKDGSTFPLELSVAAFRVGEQWHAVATLRDITRRKQWQQRLEELATTDELTGVHNRRSFLRLARHELERSRRYGRPLAVLMLDVDHFKNVNDTWGHDVGDDVLRLLARTCQGELREVDVFGRIGGEEFAALLSESGCEDARSTAERLRRAVEASRVPVAEAPGGELAVTISLGVACCAEACGLTVEALLKAADEAMYEAKRGGRNQVRVQGEVLPSPEDPGPEES